MFLFLNTTVQFLNTEHQCLNLMTKWPPKIAKIISLNIVMSLENTKIVSCFEFRILKTKKRKYLSNNIALYVVQGQSQDLNLGGVALLLVVCGDSSIQLSCLKNNGFFFFFFLMYVSKYGQNYFVKKILTGQVVRFG